jgi:hypothetical protein
MHAIMASAEAAALIRERLKKVEGKDEFVGYVPCLAFGSQRVTRNGLGGQVIEYYRGEHFQIGLYPSTKLADPRYTKVGVEGMTLVVHVDVLQGQLVGKKLVVETVQVGYPNPSAKTDRVLKAVNCDDI